MDQYAVFGNPVKHSRSPYIHQCFARQFGHQLEYKAIEVSEGDFEEAVDSFFSRGGKGLNITVPFKLHAFKMAAQRSERAVQAAAANTLMLNQKGEIYADNTDGIGLVRDLRQNLGWPIKGRKVLVLGAGGAVRGVLAPLLAESPACVCIANRTEEKAAELVALFSPLVPVGTLNHCAFQALEAGYFDLVINGTSASMAGDVPPVPTGVVGKHSACYDMMYGAEPTAFLRWAKSQGSEKASDGLGMLVEQAAESFFLWRHESPATKAVIEQIRHQMTNQ